MSPQFLSVYAFVILNSNYGNEGSVTSANISFTIKNRQSEKVKRNRCRYRSRFLEGRENDKGRQTEYKTSGWKQRHVHVSHPSFLTPLILSNVLTRSVLARRRG